MGSSKSKWILVGALVGVLILAGGVLLISPSMGEKVMEAGPPSDWNDFNVLGLAPARDQVEAAKVAAPAAERAIAVASMTRVLSPMLVPPEFADRLIALNGWEGGNVFILRERIGAHWVQVTEGAGKVVVEIVKADGSALVDPTQDPAEYARLVAREVLSAEMQPQEFHSVSGQLPAVAVWKTLAGGDTDAEGVALSICRAFAGPTFLRYEVHEEVVGTQELGARPRPYAFGEPVPPVTPRRLRPSEQPEEAVSPPSGTEPIHISNSISDEDLAHEVSPEGLKDE
jgi:hypothetical protein